MSIFEDTNPRALKDLLGEIHSRTMALPDFQRDFVWEPVATQELIVSIAYNYPAGSILRVRDRARLFAAREFEGAPKLDGGTHTFLVLDGQQRLTSLYQAFFGVGEHKYYLSLKKLIDGADFEDALFHVRASTKWAQAREDFSVQARELLMPLSVLKGGAGGFLQWVIKVTNPMPADDRTAMLDRLTRIDEDWIKTIDDYHFPVVTLSEKTEADALCTIFETLNRTGVKLSVFELLTARFWPHGINLRALWDEAKAAYPIIADFEVDPYSVLQAIALASRDTPSCKRGDVLNMSASDIREWWDRVVLGLVDGLGILRDDCKVMLPKWLPYNSMIAPLAAVLAGASSTRGPEAGAMREKLKRWFWCAVFGQAYDSSANSQAAKDVAELRTWMGGGPAPESVRGLRFDPNTLLDVTPRQRAIYSGTICLILGSGTGARDFHSGGLITTSLMVDQDIDDHHVFPDDYLLRHRGISLARRRDCVLNRTLIDRSTNQRISNRAPSDYLAEMRTTRDFPFDEVLTSHCLPSGNESALLCDDFDRFLMWRQERLWAEIRRVTGLVEATDLESAQDS
ncbi:MAG: DUF262 domain-containing protein [Holophagales bacterium]|nr:MAG: DUF262 domain-containing protein [Holophagales bacterium]